MCKLKERLMEKVTVEQTTIDALIIKKEERKIPEIQYQELLGSKVVHCNNCETDSKVEINKEYVCLNCYPEYKEYFQK